jgi:cyclopropane-fatty-acyl-phospholipid synthase
MSERRSQPAEGASARAIQHHYDVSNAFYALWLDESTMSYTSALFAEGETAADLDRAQERKIDYLVEQTQGRGASCVLDIGCGWGNTLSRLVNVHGARKGVGLTLSPQQAAWVRRQCGPEIEVRVESWRDHVPAQPYQAIYSVESIEAFARPGLTRAQKVAIYRDLFSAAHSWLAPGGHFGLQMIAYGNSAPEDLDSFISERIFPESDLPRLSEVIEACEGLFEVRSLRNDRAHYATTLRAWLVRLRAGKDRAIAEVGAEVVDTYEKYLRLSVFMFDSGACDLHRVSFKRIDRPRRTP